MGVYIKGMEMPTDCALLLKIFPDGRVGVPVHLNWAGTMVVNDAKAVPVPPHGRLGDLDALEQMFSDIDNAPYSGFDGEEPFYSAEDAARIIRLAPTIIPASEEGE